MRHDFPSSACEVLLERRSKSCASSSPCAAMRRSGCPRRLVSRSRRCVRLSIWRAIPRCNASAKLATSRNRSEREGAASSAAAVGVGARWSEAKSAMVKSVSCPTPLITGIGQLRMARASASSLKAHRSSMDPPPRAIISTSHSLRSPACCTARVSCAAAPSPCTADG